MDERQARPLMGQLDRPESTPRLDEDGYRRIVELANEGIWTSDRDAVTTFVNPAMARMLGYAAAEMIGRPIVEFLDEEGQVALKDRIARRREGFTDRYQDTKFIHRDGHAVWTILSATPLTGPTGEYVGALALVTDVTARRETEQVLIASEQRFRAVVQNATDVVNISNVDGIMTYLSPSVERMLGFTPEELVGTQARDLLHPDDLARVEESVVAQWAAGTEDEPLRYRVRHRNGSWRIVNALFVNLFDEPSLNGVVSTMWDVTKRVEAEAALAETRGRFAALARHATDLVTVSNADGVVTYVSPSVKAILGYEPAELEGTEAALLPHPDDLPALLDAVMADLEAGTEPQVLTYRALHKDGSWRTLEGVSQNLLDDQDVQGVVTNARDVTESRAAELKAAQLTAVLEASDEVVVISDPDGSVVYANQIARRLLGPDDHHHVTELASPESRERLRTEIMPIVREKGVWSGELELLGNDGVGVPVAGTIQAHRDEHGALELVSTIAHDISELKAAQRRLEHEATHDALTGLPNRVFFLEIGERALARAARACGPLGVLFLDLDGFKLVNDGLGHDIGDQLLAQLALRLRDAVRLGDTVARLGGDEFVVLCEHPGSEKEMLDLAHRVIAVLSEPFRFEGVHDVQVGGSVGIAYGGDLQAGISALIREADVALYQAKHDGRGRAQVFDASQMGRAPAASRA